VVDVRVTPDLESISRYMAHYYNTLSVLVKEFQGDGDIIHKLQWTGKEGFRKWKKQRADWVWVRQQERAPEDRGIGQLDGRMVRRLGRLFRVHENIGRIHEIALVMLLRLCGSARLWKEEGMIQVAQRADGNSMYVIRIADIERMTHLILLETEKVWLVNNRIDFRIWNELYA